MLRRDPLRIGKLFRSASRRVGRAPLASAMAIGAIAVALYVVAYPFVVVKYPPLTDLPFHAAQSSVIAHYGDPAWHFREQFTLQLLKVPYWTHYGMAALFSFVMPITAAVKLSTIISLSMVPGGLAVLFHGMRKSPFLGLLGLVLVWNTLTHWGFINFTAAVGLCAGAIGFAFLVLDRPTTGRKVGLAITLVLVFATHIFRFPFAIAAVTGATLLLYPATRRIKDVLVPMLPALALFGLWFLVRDKDLSTQGMAPLTVHWERTNEIEQFLFNGFTGPEERVLANKAGRIVAIVAAVCLVGFLYAARWRTWTRRDRFFHAGCFLTVACVTAVFFTMYLVLPMEIGLWWYVYPREILSTFVIALALVPDLPKPSIAKLPLLAALSWATMNQAFFVAKSFYAFNYATTDFQQIVKAIPQAPRLGYMVFDHTGSNKATTPFIHLPAWVQAEKGGWLSFHFVGWNAAPVKYRPYVQGGRDVPPPTPLRFEWQPQLFDISTRGKFFDWFLVRSRSAPDNVFAADPTIKRVEHQGSWWLYHREGAR